MPDINAQIADFFVHEGDLVQAADTPDAPDVAITSSTVPETESGARITHLIDGVNYFGELRKDIAKLLAGGSDRFFYTNSWTLGTSPTPDVVPIAGGLFPSAWQASAKRQTLPSGKTCNFWDQPAIQLQDDTDGPFRPFHDDIRDMAQAGVDVRVLVWANPFLVDFKQAAFAAGCFTLQYWGVNVHSLRSLLDLRLLQNMRNKVVINTLAHTLGAMHLKMVICGDSTGFRGYVGGIDFTQFRNAKPTHQNLIDGTHNDWHDVMVKVEGSAVNGLYRCFSELWDEQVRRSAKTFKAYGEEIKTHFDDTPLVPERFAVAINDGKCHTQVLETLPAANYATFGSDRTPLVSDVPVVGDVPVVRQVADCAFRIYSGFKQQKLSFAEHGRFEFRAAMRKAIQQAQQYIYIEDQAMENIELGPWINERLRDVPELKVILLYGGDPADPPSPDLPEFVKRVIALLPDPQERVVFVKAPYIVHAKVTIVDDVWASVGSSNSWVRSFYLDGEINVAVIDEADPPFAARLRKDLWGELCGKQPGDDCDPLLPLSAALGIWRNSWGMTPFGFDLRQDMMVKTIPLVFMPKPGPSDPPLPPEVFEAQPPPTQAQREQSFGADSRLEY
jgi:phosphatidylserine/phosphatidylglycerophosphate/cardiolipin synthase-like enzyme